MNERTKRILLLISFILSAVLVALLIYWVFFSGPGGYEQVNINGTLVNVPTGELPNINGVIVNINRNTNQVVSANTNAYLPVIDEIAQGGLTLTPKVKDDEADFATKSIDGEGLAYYNRLDGKFYRLDPETMTEYAMSDRQFYSVRDVQWSPTKDRAILDYPDGSKIMYDFTNETQYTLPSQFSEVDFSRDGRELTVKYLDPEDESNNWLAVANADGTGLQAVEPLSDEADNFVVDTSPTGQIIGMYTESTGAEEQEIYMIGKYGENLKSVSVNGRGFESQWSTDGQRILYSAHSSQTDYKPNLWVVDASGESIGENKINLGINTTADKCTFSSASSVICAVPVNMPRGSGAFPELASSSPDVFYQIDLNSGQKSQIAIPTNEDGSGTFQAYNIFTDDSGQYLYFTDRFTGQVRKVRLR